MEAAEKYSRGLKNSVSLVQHFSSGTKQAMVPKKTRTCYHCGQKPHDQKDCRFHEEDCHLCGKRGHIASVCKSREWQGGQT